MFESRNPILDEEKINSIYQAEQAQGVQREVMTVSGAVNKTLILTGILLITSIISFVMPSSLFLYSGLIGGIIALLVATFKPHTSPISAPVYAAFEGLFLGTVSAYYAFIVDGIILQAVSLTIGTLVTMLMLYKSGLITVNQKFRAGVMMATGAIAIVYLVAIVGRMFGWQMPYLHQGGAIGIGISLVIIAVAALNLLLDFDNFEKSAEARSPKFMEWFCGMSLLVTLVWLYIEFLRLLSKLNRD